jgi:dihydroorotate dehydrogenase (fumarate)
MIDMRCRYLGLTLRSPIVASASPLTARLSTLQALHDAGVGAVVLPSLFEEEIEADSMTLSHRLDVGAESSAEAASYLPARDLSLSGAMSHIRLVKSAKSELEIPVIASLNGATDGGWVRYAAMLADAGADAIELNLYSVQADERKSSSEVEAEYLQLVEHIRWAVSVPLAVKLSPYLSSTANFVQQLRDLGVDGVVLFNRFVQPDIDVETFDVVSGVALSQHAEMLLPLRWIGLLRPVLPDLSLGLSSGVRSGVDVVKAVLAGADVVMMASELLRRGPVRAREIEVELRAWMAAHEYQAVSQMRGSVASNAARDPCNYERAQYIHNLLAHAGVVTR